MKSFSTPAVLTSAVLGTLLLGASLSSQTVETIQGKRVVVIGCINRAQQDGSLAGSPGVPPASTRTAPQLANSSAPTNNFLLNGATSAHPESQDRAAATSGQLPTPTYSYVLDGAREELEKHLGHQVEVSGALTVVREGAEPEIENQVQHLKVEAIRMLAASCPSASDR